MAFQVSWSEGKPKRNGEWHVITMPNGDEAELVSQGSEVHIRWNGTDEGLADLRVFIEERIKRDPFEFDGPDSWKLSEMNSRQGAKVLARSLFAAYEGSERKSFVVPVDWEEIGEDPWDVVFDG